jgi:hypothetical protein
VVKEVVQQIRIVRELPLIMWSFLRAFQFEKHLSLELGFVTKLTLIKTLLTLVKE